MKNTEKLIKICDALQLEDVDVVEMLALSHIEMDEEDAEDLLSGEVETLDYEVLEAFLNGIIVFNRGEAPLKPGQTERIPTPVEDPRSINNVVLKKLKIAFSFSSDDMLELLNEGELKTSKEKLSSLFRKEGHKSYKYCRDIYLNAFLEALGKKEVM